MKAQEALDEKKAQGVFCSRHDCVCSPVLAPAVACGGDDC